MIKAIIFDMGGVLLRTADPAPREELAARYGVTVKELFTIIFTSDSSQQAEKGERTEEDHWRWAFEKLGVKPEDRDQFLRQWWAGDRMDYELLAFINSLRPTYKTGLLSNAWASTRENIAKHWGGLEQYFDVVVFSAEVRMRKPAPEFFHWLLDRLEVKPEEAIFVDDYGVNIDAANSLGMHAIKFCSSEQAIEDILGALNHKAVGQVSALRVNVSPLDNFDSIRCIGVVSDTHTPDRVRTLHPDLVSGLRTAGVELIVHAGDICVPSVLEELSQVAPVIAVRGNRDWAFTGVLPWNRTITVGSLRIGIQHGMGDFWHYWLDKFKYASVGYRFERYKRLLKKTSPDMDVHIFGHTHRGENRVEEGVLYFNPGSAAITPPIWPSPSFGVLHLDGNSSIRGEHVTMRRLRVHNGFWVEDE